MAGSFDKYGWAYLNSQQKPGLPDPFSPINPMTGRPFGDYEAALKDRMVKEGIVSTDQTKDWSKQGTEYSTQGLEVLPEEQYLALKERIAADPEYMAAIASARALDQLNALTMAAPAKLDISPVAQTASVLLNDPRLAQLAQRQPAAVDELSNLKEGAAASVEAAQRVGSLKDVLSGRNLAIKTKVAATGQSGSSTDKGLTINIAGQAQTPPPPKAAGAGKGDKEIDLSGKTQWKSATDLSLVDKTLEKFISKVNEVGYDTKNADLKRLRVQLINEIGRASKYGSLAKGELELLNSLVAQIGELDASTALGYWYRGGKDSAVKSLEGYKNSIRDSISGNLDALSSDYETKSPITAQKAQKYKEKLLGVQLEVGKGGVTTKTTAPKEKSAIQKRREEQLKKEGNR